MIEKWYFVLENRFADIRCDEYVIIPNHFFAIIITVGADLSAATSASTASVSALKTGSPLPKMVQWFKTMSTNEYIWCKK